MDIDLKQAKKSPESKIPFSGCLKLCEDITGDKPITDFSYEGSYRFSDDSLFVEGSGKISLSGNCIRCGKAMDYEIYPSLKDRIILSDGDYPVTDDKLDFDSFLREKVIFSLPQKLLCAANCKGLCSSCGKDLNLGECDCINTVSPFAVLKDKYK